ncbi:MAG: HAMP domain-containing histidine kinase [Cyanobacteria bacterium SZAS-4]|nr:HAMP domain-containing histidine kinase [Cyanobacteria bacterium SZAS-4]
MNLKITQMGFILVGIPLVFELVFVGILAYRMQQAEIEIKKQAATKQILFITGSLGILAGQAAGYLAGYSRMPSRYFRTRYRSTVKQWSERYHELEILLADDPKHLKILNDTKPSFLKGIRLMGQIEESIDNGGEGKVVNNPMQLLDVKNLIDSLSDPVGLIMTDYIKLAEEGPKREDKAKEQVMYTIAVGVAVNIILAIFLANLFTTGIGKRVKRVQENIRRVPKGIPLNKPLEGTDEIAQLDTFFHSMVDELEEARKMQRYLIAMVSHDLRSPLTTVSGLLTLLNAGAWGELTDEAQQKVGTAEADIHRLIALTNDLLDTERLASGKLELTFGDATISEAIHEAVESVRTFADQHHVKLEEPEASEQTAEFDKDRIVQVMVNLLSNAVKYSPADSSVSVGFECDRQWLHIWIQDQGRGVPADFQTIIFEKFQQVTESDAREKGGKGLGLSICKTIVVQHGGTIGVESENGSGSKFWFRIPVKQRQSFNHVISLSDSKVGVPKS